MRQSDGLPPDPDMLDELEAIDATLLGLVVDPVHAELAELTVLLAGERAQMSEEFAQELDTRVAIRFARASAADRRARRRPRRRLLLGSSLFGGGIAAAAAVAIGIVVIGSGGAGSSRNQDLGAFAAPTARHAAAGVPRIEGLAKTPGSERPTPGPLTTATSSASPTTGATKHAPSHATSAASGAGVNGASASASYSAAATVPAASPPVTSAHGTTAPVTSAPAPTANGRAIVQSAQLQLTAPSSKIDTVSEEVFQVVGQENGIVKTSSVTAGNDAYATFSLSIPSGNLQDTMTRLSELHDSSVASRTDATQDVNDQYLNDQRNLADARALRTSLLKQLANAVTDTQVESITGQLHDAEASIRSDESTLNGLQGRINYSPLALQINAGQVIVNHPRPEATGGFTLHKAAHDAVRVLTVVAGIALISLAALTPLALLVALGLWIGYWVRRRRREAALDSA